MLDYCGTCWIYRSQPNFCGGVAFVVTARWGCRGDRLMGLWAGWTSLVISTALVTN